MAPRTTTQVPRVIYATCLYCRSMWWLPLDDKLLVPVRVLLRVP